MRLTVKIENTVTPPNAYSSDAEVVVDIPADGASASQVAAQLVYAVKAAMIAVTYSEQNVANAFDGFEVEW